MDGNNTINFNVKKLISLTVFLVNYVCFLSVFIYFYTKSTLHLVSVTHTVYVLCVCLDFVVYFNVLSQNFLRLVKTPTITTTKTYYERAGHAGKMDRVTKVNVNLFSP